MVVIRTGGLYCVAEACSVRLAGGDSGVAFGFVLCAAVVRVRVTLGIIVIRSVLICLGYLCWVVVPL